MEVYFKPGDVVWCKLGPFWWPGEVADKTKVPEDVTGNLKREPVAIIQFFDDEGYYECVKSSDCIYHYNCERKNDFIKKGMDAYRANNPKMVSFPKDIVVAEEKTGGNASILSDPMFTPERKRTSMENVSVGTPSKKLKHSASKNKKKKPVITHRRFLGYDDYESHVLIQRPVSNDNANITGEEDATANFKCPTCPFTTDTLNILMMHTSCHHGEGAMLNQSAGPSSSPRKLDKKKRKKLNDNGDSSDDKKEKTKRKYRKRKDDALTNQTKDENGEKKGDNEKTTEEKKDVCVDIIADWDDEDQETTDVSTLEATTTTTTSDNDKSLNAETSTTSVIEAEPVEKTMTPTPTPPPPQNNGNKKEKDASISCFDFDEDEEITAIPDATSGRKIPRVIPPTDKKFDLDEFEIDDDDEEEENKKKVLEESQKLAEKNNAENEDDVVDKDAEELDKTYKLLMDSTSKIELPDIPNALKSEQNFHCAKTVKYPDKPAEYDENVKPHEDVETMTSKRIQEIVIGHVKENEVCAVPYEDVVHSENVLSSLDADFAVKKDETLFDLSNKPQHDVLEIEETTPKKDDEEVTEKNERRRGGRRRSSKTHRSPQRRKSTSTKDDDASNRSAKRRNSEDAKLNDESSKRTKSSTKKHEDTTRRKSSSKREHQSPRRSSTRHSDNEHERKTPKETQAVATLDAKNDEMVDAVKTKDTPRSTRRSTRTSHHHHHHHHQDEDQKQSSDSNVAEVLTSGRSLRLRPRKGDEELLKLLVHTDTTRGKEPKTKDHSDQSYKHRKLRHSHHVVGSSFEKESVLDRNDMDDDTVEAVAKDYHHSKDKDADGIGDEEKLVDDIRHTTADADEGVGHTSVEEDKSVNEAISHTTADEDVCVSEAASHSAVDADEGVGELGSHSTTDVDKGFSEVGSHATTDVDKGVSEVVSHVTADADEAVVAVCHTNADADEGVGAISHTTADADEDDGAISHADAGEPGAVSQSTADTGEPGATSHTTSDADESVTAHETNTKETADEDKDVDLALTNTIEDGVNGASDKVDDSSATHDGHSEPTPNAGEAETIEKTNENIHIDTPIEEKLSEVPQIEVSSEELITSTVVTEETVITEQIQFEETITEPQPEMNEATPLETTEAVPRVTQETNDVKEKVAKPRKPSRWDQKERTTPTSARKKKSRWDQVEANSKSTDENVTNSCTGTGTSNVQDLFNAHQMSPVLKFDSTIAKSRKTTGSDDVVDTSSKPEIPEESVESQVARITHYEEVDQSVVPQVMPAKSSTLDEVIEEMESVENEVVVECETRDTTKKEEEKEVTEKAVNEVATKLTNPKKRFVKSFEESNKREKEKDEQAVFRQSAMFNLKKKILAQNTDAFCEKNLGFRKEFTNESELSFPQNVVSTTEIETKLEENNERENEKEKSESPGVNMSDGEKSNIDEPKIEIITKNFPIENEKEEPELVPLVDGNLTVVSEKELSEGQVELTASLPVSKKPSLLNFSMDFSDDSMDNSFEILKKEKIMDIAASLDVTKDEKSIEEPKNTSIVEETLVQNTVDKIEEKLIELNRGGENQAPIEKAEPPVVVTPKPEKKSPKKQEKKTPPKPAEINEPLVFYNTAKSSNVTEMCDLEDHIPSQIVCAKKALMDDDVIKVALNQEIAIPKTEPMSKLLNRLTCEKDNKNKEVDLKSLKLDTNAAKTLIKSAIKGKSAVPPNVGTKTGNKAIILSEKIIKPATTLGHLIKKNYEDLEAIKPYVIAKNQKVEVRKDVQYAKIGGASSSKSPLTKQFVVNKPANPGKAKILNQTIIRPAGDRIQTKTVNVDDSNMDFDINSMPIVLSDELLTAESLESMPIVLSDPKATTNETLRLIPASTGNAKVLNRTLNLQPEQTNRLACFKKTQQNALIQHKIPVTTGTYQKIIRHTAPSPNVAKPGKYIILPENTNKAQFLKKTTTGVIKRPPTTAGIATSSSSSAAETTGHKIMIVTNPSGQKQRVLLTPAQQKMMGLKNQTTPVQQQQLIKTTPNKILNTSALPMKTHQTIVRAAQQESQIKFAQNRKVQKVYMPATQNKPTLQKTILIRNQHGQTVRKIQGTDDAMLDKQVAEQIEAIKVNSLKAQQRQQELNARNAISKPIVQSTVPTAARRSYPRKSDIVKQTPKLPDQNVPPLMPIKTTSSSETKKEDVVKPAVDRPLNQLVIQDNMGNQTTVTEGQILALPSETVDGQPQSYMLVTLDESGNLTPLNNEALMSLDPSLVGLGGDFSNMVLQMDGGKDETTPEPPKATEETHAKTPPPPVPLPVQQQQQPPTVQSQVQVTCNINGEPGQQIILTGDPVATQKFLDSLSEGNTDLANILANAEGSNSFLIQADGQQILINTDPTSAASTNSEQTIGTTGNATDDAAGNPMFASHHHVTGGKNQDILAAALADTDMFQQDHVTSHNNKSLHSQLSPSQTLYPMNVGNVLETSLTLNSPIMTPLEVPSMNSKKILDEEADILSVPTKNVDLPITITDPNISHTVSQQVVDLQTNLELTLPITETIISTGSTDMQSPSSYVYSLPNLDDEQKAFGGANMPLLTEDLDNGIPAATTTKTSIVMNRLEQVKPARTGIAGNTFIEEGLCTLGGEMCSSLSEPPPEMFETNDKLQLVDDEIEIPVQPQIVTDLKDCLDDEKSV